jgi:hypothetical protein
MHRVPARSFAYCLAWVAAATVAGCSGGEAEEEPVATAEVTLSASRVAAGSPLHVTYRFVAAEDATFDGDYRVLVHLVDTDEQQMWTDDHDPPVPTSQWKAGQTVEYTRTIFVPVLPYVGEAYFDVGLYRNDRRLPLGGEHVGQHAYRVARLQLLPQTENIFTVFRDGWHPAEVQGDNPNVEWQWTKKDASLAFKNPKQPITFYLDVDNPGGDILNGQQVQVSAAGNTVDEFTLKPHVRTLRKIAIPPERLGHDDIAEIVISVDKTFVPAQSNLSPQDKRELGIRVFHAFVEPVK